MKKYFIIAVVFGIAFMINRLYVEPFYQKHDINFQFHLKYFWLFGVLPYLFLTIIFSRYFWLQDKVDNGFDVSTLKFPSWWNGGNIFKIKIVRFLFWVLALASLYFMTNSYWMPVVGVAIIWQVGVYLNARSDFK